MKIVIVVKMFDGEIVFVFVEFVCLFEIGIEIIQMFDWECCYIYMQIYMVLYLLFVVIFLFVIGGLIFVEKGWLDFDMFDVFVDKDMF